MTLSIEPFAIELSLDLLAFEQPAFKPPVEFASLDFPAFEQPLLPLPFKFVPLDVLAIGRCVLRVRGLADAE